MGWVSRAGREGASEKRQLQLQGESGCKDASLFAQKGVEEGEERHVCCSVKVRWGKDEGAD